MRKYGIPAFALVCLIVISTPSRAEWRRAEPRDFSIQFTLGLGAALGRSLVEGLDNDGNPTPELFLVGGIDYRRWFLESSKRNAYTNWSDSIIGYRLWEDDQSGVSIITTSYNNSFGPEEDIFIATQTPELEGLNNREGDQTLGIRYQQHWDDNFISLEFAQDLITHHGIIAQVYYSHTDQRRNWDINWNTGVAFLTRRVMDYYYGVDEDETSGGLSTYAPTSGQRLHLSVNAQRPLSESWYLDAGLGINLHSTSFTNSPITRDNPEYVARITFNYVF